MSLITDYLKAATKGELHDLMNQIQDVLFEKHEVKGFLTVYVGKDPDGITQSIIRRTNGIEGKLALMGFLDIERMEMLLSIKKQQDELRNSKKENDDELTR